MKTALLSVYHKKGIVNFARQLIELGWDIIASGGTAKALANADVPVRNVAELVGGPAILGHRVVTLSREVHAGLSATDSADDVKELAGLGIPRIDLVCVDLYPLHEAINDPNNTTESVIEKTDIGGPAMLRNGAKGRRIVICDPNDRQGVINWLKNGKPEEQEFLTELAAKAEAVVAEYCLTSARYHSQGSYDGFIGRQVETLRYGENPWQTPAISLSNKLLSNKSGSPLSLDAFQPIAGIKPSYVNVADLDRLLQTITHVAAVFDINRFQVPLIAVACKHGNPCGVAAVGNNSIEVIQKMVSGDTRAIFGGLVMTNFPLATSEAEALLTHLMPEGKRRLLNGIIAPLFSEKAVQILKRKKDTCRFLINPALNHLNYKSLDSASRFRYIRDGFLRQPNYNFVLDLQNIWLEKIGDITTEQEDDLLLAWAIGSTSNSNTITIVKDHKLIGNGVGQPDRVGACELAISKARNAGHSTTEAVAYSDSFFPFSDGPAVLAEAEVKVILASSGSIRDQEVKTFCQEHGLTLYLIPDKVGRGFFNH